MRNKKYQIKGEIQYIKNTIEIIYTVLKYCLEINMQYLFLFMDWFGMLSGTILCQLLKLYLLEEISPFTLPLCLAQPNSMCRMFALLCFGGGRMGRFSFGFSVILQWQYMCVYIYIWQHIFNYFPKKFKVLKFIWN